MPVRRITRWVLVAALFFALTAGGLFSSGTSFAAQAGATMAVSATVLNVCTVLSTPLTFPNYTGAAVTANATVTVTCTAGTAETIGLDAGSNGGQVVGVTRAMKFGTNYLGYEIYQNSGLTTVWGNSGAAAETSTGTGLAQLLTAYGQTPASQLTVPAGVYADTVNVTVTY